MTDRDEQQLIAKKLKNSFGAPVQAVFSQNLKTEKVIVDCQNIEGEDRENYFTVNGEDLCRLSGKVSVIKHNASIENLKMTLELREEQIEDLRKEFDEKLENFRIDMRNELHEMLLKHDKKFSAYVKSMRAAAELILASTEQAENN